MTKQQDAALVTDWVPFRSVLEGASESLEDAEVEDFLGGLVVVCSVFENASEVAVDLSTDDNEEDWIEVGEAESDRSVEVAFEKRTAGSF